MSYIHRFTGLTEGIRSTAPVVWRQLDGLMSAYWEAQGDTGGRGYYISENPRISIFFEDVSSIRIVGPEVKPMARAFYVPAGMPMRTAFTSPLSFSHLDIHLDLDWAMKFLAPVLDRASARRVLTTPAAVDEAHDLEAVARLLVDEVRTPARHDLYAECLAGSLVTAVLDLDGAGRDPGNARLTRAQMRKVAARFEAGGGRRLSVAEMASAVNLSESWFSQVFKNTTGVTPLRWQLDQRIALVQRLLTQTSLSVADVADRLGFADQAHLTKAFRQAVGETPAAWRRAGTGA